MGLCFAKASDTPCHHLHSHVQTYSRLITTCWSTHASRFPSEGLRGGSTSSPPPSPERDVAGGLEASVAAGGTPAASAGRVAEGEGGEGGGGTGERNFGGGLLQPNGQATNKGWASEGLLSSSRQASGKVRLFNISWSLARFV